MAQFKCRNWINHGEGTFSRWWRAVWWFSNMGGYLLWLFVYNNYKLVISITKPIAKTWWWSIKTNDLPNISKIKTGTYIYIYMQVERKYSTRTRKTFSCQYLSCIFTSTIINLKPGVQVKIKCEVSKKQQLIFSNHVI